MNYATVAELSKLSSLWLFGGSLDPETREVILATYSRLAIYAKAALEPESA